MLKKLSTHSILSLFIFGLASIPTSEFFEFYLEFIFIDHCQAMKFWQASERAREKESERKSASREAAPLVTQDSIAR